MKSRKFTVVAQLHEKQNQDLIEYVDSCFATYGKAKRETFHVLKRHVMMTLTNQPLIRTYKQNTTS